MHILKRNPFKCIWWCSFLNAATELIFLNVYFYIVCFVSCKWYFSSLCSVQHKAIWCMHFITLRGEEVLRTADRLHKPLMIQKRQHVLSNCQKLTSRIVIGPLYEVLPRFYVCGVCVQACVLDEWLCMSLCACFDTCVCTHPCVCVFHECIRIWVCTFVCVYIQHVCFFLTNHFYLSLQLLCCTSVDLINGNMPGQDEKKPHFMKQNDGFIAQGAPWGFPWAPTSKRF